MKSGITQSMQVPTAEKHMIGKGIAMAGVAVAAAYLEVNGKEAGGLWCLLVLWIMFTEWNT